MPVSLEKLQGKDLLSHLDALADLRMNVFRDFPYLYDGSQAYERDYLRTYATSPDSICIIAQEDKAIVGASTAIPMADETDAFRQPFVDAGWDPDDIFYYGESVLLPDYRGKGIGVAFFDRREEHARQQGYRYAVFCAVVRPDDHPARPKDYESLDRFWHHRGYQPIAGLETHYAWTDIGGSKETEKPMQFWFKAL
ncbi:GNAT family N-acetyltransferase [Marinobacter nanhaiticus D15-8W]|uniref:GNAT family N-acetyltransferase n=1 Tax=Marinobacter nanhaiticus D15-8W TaxID=626887 RepID=N6WYB1_9GAMM|nr:GNAT family N-acetyltransferase [Marinobacter nanhaiticus]ENO16591.1 GNAT family N-acetyltransferase [Marinobacter nanhaiticus D15-8W]BES72388.1 GNAT family N-acetyltransferase [Marinobacter nanhaiticus D15-8W]